VDRTSWCGKHMGAHMVDSVLRAAVLGLVIRALRRDAPHVLPCRTQQRRQAHIHAEAVRIACETGVILLYVRAHAEVAGNGSRALQSMRHALGMRGSVGSGSEATERASCSGARAGWSTMHSFQSPLSMLQMSPTCASSSISVVDTRRNASLR